MKVIQSSTKDLDIIMSIVKDAQAYLASLNIDQWQDGYPDKDRILTDIEKNESYLVVDNNEVVGTFMFTSRKEPTYKNIEGDWIIDESKDYGVVHRIAVFDKYRGSGFAKFVFDYCEQKLKEYNISSFKIDTHKDNKGMQYLLEKREFTYCGIIYLERGGERLAYEKVL